MYDQSENILQAYLVTHPFLQLTKTNFQERLSHTHTEAALNFHQFQCPIYEDTNICTLV